MEDQIEKLKEKTKELKKIVEEKEELSEYITLEIPKGYMDLLDEKIDSEEVDFKEKKQENTTLSALKESIRELKKISEIENEGIKSNVDTVKKMIKDQMILIRELCRQESVDIATEVSKEYANDQSKEINDVIKKAIKIKIGRFALINTNINMRPIQ